MVFALMFDNYQEKVHADQWCVSRSGTLDFCRQYSVLSSDFMAWAKSDFGDRVWREDHPLGSERGAIYELTPVGPHMLGSDDGLGQDPTRGRRSLALPLAMLISGLTMGLAVRSWVRKQGVNSVTGDGE
ncbi:hypothetical protein SAMN05518849_1253 [Sphingobium sp. AP50]|uniref:hypothetical protein n=1 Tax=Sphingobium sp. AP50 TaxID=1884369 RepID=UPI0008C3DB65|nr:hypothetical protein [Sphingobium sp. AP50]SEK00134.1 hypothetical protein SAMN05518849_1253 [Sphingobium sp. AP50]